MALGDSYATTAELKARVNETTSTYDTALGEALSAVSRAIESFCGRQFNKTTTAAARDYYPDYYNRTDIDDFHTITDLVIATDLSNDGTYETTWLTTDYQLEPLNGIVDGVSGWPYRRIRAVGVQRFPCVLSTARAPLRVTAQWGWTAVPAPVKEACLILAEEQYKLKDAPFGVAGFGAYGAVRVRSNPKAAEMLGPYQLVPILIA